jgi:hypothetical protein
LRNELLTGLRDRLLSQGSVVVDRLMELVRSSNEQVAVSACKIILDRLLPQKKEITMPNTDLAPENILTDERLREMFGKLDAEGLLSTAEQRATYDAYREQLTLAEADPDFEMIPAGFCVGSPEWQRLQAWRRHRFPELAEAEFRMLHVLKAILAEKP